MVFFVTKIVFIISFQYSVSLSLLACLAGIGGDATNIHVHPWKQRGASSSPSLQTSHLWPQHQALASLLELEKIEAGESNEKDVFFYKEIKWWAMCQCPLSDSHYAPCKQWTHSASWTYHLARRFLNPCQKLLLQERTASSRHVLIASCLSSSFLNSCSRYCWRKATCLMQDSMEALPSCELEARKH